MRRLRTIHTIFYILCSALAMVYSVHFLYNKIAAEGSPSLLVYLLIAFIGVLDGVLFEGALDIYRFSRMKILGNWLIRSTLYSILFFVFILKRPDILSLTTIQSFMIWGMLFSLPALVKFIILSLSSHKLKNKTITYTTLLIGYDQKTQDLYQELNKKMPSMGQDFVGSLGNGPLDNLTYFGTASELERVITQHQIEEVIVSLGTEQYAELSQIIHRLRSVKTSLLIRITPDSYNFLMGHVKLDSLYSAALIELPAGKMKLWQSLLKRTADVFVSCIILVLLSPLILILVIKTNQSSHGPILYSQLRIGKYGRPFSILKFRSMYTNAEESGPQLTQESDDRCTPWGSFMRKWRLDELPQFLNVIRGDMSIVGPRPERQFFIDQIKNIAPYYSRILTVSPGITSWGQVKFGYASDIKQMVERLKFDLIYVENLSLSLDIKIILYTILVLFQGKGR